MGYLDYAHVPFPLCHRFSDNVNGNLHKNHQMFRLTV